MQTDKTVRGAAASSSTSSTASIKPIPADELDKAKNYVALLLPRGFEATGSVAATLAAAFIYDLPRDYFATYTERVRAVTANDVKRAADRYIQTDKLTVVIVGDRKVIEPGVRALNLGPLRIVTPRELGILE